VWAPAQREIAADKLLTVQQQRGTLEQLMTQRLEAQARHTA
jgi:hypothetical protein